MTEKAALALDEAGKNIEVTSDAKSPNIPFTDPKFLCQRCCQPLKIDVSFDPIEQLLYDVVAFYQNTNDPPTSDLGRQSKLDEALREFTPPERFFRDVRFDGAQSVGHNGFTVLDAPTGEDSGQGAEHHHLSQKMKMSAFLFDFINKQMEVGHPLCEECTDAILDAMDQQLKLVQNECRDYNEYLERMREEEEAGSRRGVDAKEAQAPPPTEEQLAEKLDALQVEEEELLKELAQLEEEKIKMENEKRVHEEELEKLAEEEDKHFKAYSEYKRQVLELEDDQRSVDNNLKYTQTQVDKLKKTNVFNSTFHIWHNGHFGTINGFRLGRLPAIPVEWAEINAAWGQTVLLLYSLAKKMNLTFKRYALVPFGNHSHVECVDDRRQLPLYGTGGFRFFWDTKFDQAMVAFLDCLQQFKEQVEKGDSGFCLPYRMDKGKIEDPSSGNSYSVKIQFNSEEQWTKALKFMLTNLKWGLAWVSSQFANKN